MKRPAAPCRDCKDRAPGCHGPDCPHGWLDYKKRLHAFTETVRRDRNYDEFTTAAGFVRLRKRVGDRARAYKHR